MEHLLRPIIQAIADTLLQQHIAPTLPALTYEQHPEDIHTFDQTTHRIHRVYTYTYTSDYGPNEALDIGRHSFFLHRLLNQDLLPYYILVRFTALFVFNDGTEDILYIHSHHHRRPETLATNDETLNDALIIANQEVSARILGHEYRQSGATYYKPIRYEVLMYKYIPLHGHGCGSLPDWLANSRSVINIDNKDNQCFKWAVARALSLRPKNNMRVDRDLVQFASQYDWYGLDNPSTFNVVNLRKFEDTYKVRITIIEVSDDKTYEFVYIRPVTEKVKKYKFIYIGLYNHHYFVITKPANIVRLAKDIDHGLHICDICLSTFEYRSSRDKHRLLCDGSPKEYIMPKEPSLYFTKYQSLQRYPCVTYADFEAITHEDGRQTPISYGLFCPDLMYLSIQHNNDPYELLSTFFNELTNLHNVMVNMFRINRSPPVTLRGYRGVCPYCKKNGNLVTHHDHFTGQLIAYICKSCNSKIKKSKELVVLFHNFKGYDSHFIIRYMYSRIPDIRIGVLGRSTEKFYQISGLNIRFLDTYSHLPFSLSQLVKDYLSDPNNRVYSSQLLPSYYKCKEVYPYEWMNSFNKLDHPSLPPIEAFYSHLTNTTISQDDYKDALDIWNKAGMTTFKDYHELYLKGDVVLLADVFETHRKMSIEVHGLDPVWFVSGPSFFWNVFLYNSMVNIELLNDVVIYNFIKRGIRGGICNVGEINEAVEDDTHCIVGLDCVNLYGRAMMFPLPIGEFRWVEPIPPLDYLYNYILSYNIESDVGYILEVDIDLPQELHDTFAAYPLFPEKDDGGSNSVAGTEGAKLLTTLHPKVNYVVHIYYLQYGLQLGYRLLKVHNILQFKQSPVLSNYIQANTEQRKLAMRNNHKAKEVYFKNANNMVYGKTIENPEKYRDYRIVTGAEKCLKEQNHPLCYRILYLSQSNELPIAIVERMKRIVKLDKPIFIGMAVLDISKRIMAEHYYRIKAYFGDRMKFLYTDTDSFYLYIGGSREEVMSDLHNIGDQYMELPDSKEKKVPGKMAFEKFVKRFKAYASKHYVVESQGISEKLKGVPKTACIKSFNEVKDRKYYIIKSKLHEVRITEVNKEVKYKDTKKDYRIDGKIVPYGYKS